MSGSRIALAVGIAVAIGVGFATRPDDRTVPVPGPVYRMDDRIDEGSGLVASATWPGVFWTHNDSGDDPVLYAVNGAGRLVREVPVAGAEAVDWEDLSRGPEGELFVGDMGNNDSDRDDLIVYRIAEPDPYGAGSAEVIGTIRFSYPDQQRLGGVENFDAEGLFFDRDTLYLLTKHRDDLDTTLYRFPALQGEVVLERLGDFTVGGDPDRYGGMVTAADLHPDGGILAVLTYHALFLFDRPGPGEHWLSRLRARVDLDQDVLDQCEAVAWDGWSVLITNEDGAIFRVPGAVHASPATYPPVADVAGAGGASPPAR